MYLTFDVFQVNVMFVRKQHLTKAVLLTIFCAMIVKVGLGYNFSAKYITEI